MTPGGSQIIDWVLIIKNGAASCASVTLTNPATSETCYWGNTLNADEWLRLSSVTQRAEISTDSGATWTRRNENMTGLIPRLQGGVSNAVTYSGPTTGTYIYEFTARG